MAKKERLEIMTEPVDEIGVKRNEAFASGDALRFFHLTNEGGYSCEMKKS